MVVKKYRDAGNPCIALNRPARSPPNEPSLAQHAGVHASQTRAPIRLPLQRRSHGAGAFGGEVLLLAGGPISNSTLRGVDTPPGRETKGPKPSLGRPLLDRQIL